MYFLCFRTPLKSEDTEAFRKREARAAKLARDIESSEAHKKGAELENGDGMDEELKHSAVIRPSTGNNEK